MLSGIVAGGTAKIIEYPLDTLKVLCQINPAGQSFSTLQFTKNLVQQEGVMRIYRGLSAPLFGSCLEYFTTFWMFGAAERYFKSMTNKHELNMVEIGFCGAFSGIGIGLVLTPVEFVKCQMQAQHTARHYKSTMHCIRYHLGSNPLNFTTGLQATLLREVPGTFVYFVAYRGSTRFFKYMTDTPQSDDASNWMILSGGAMAGLSFWGLFYPVDLIKSHMQTQEQYVTTATAAAASTGNTSTATATTVMKQNQSVPRLIIDRVRQYGVMSLYNGYSVTIPRAIISNSCIFFVYEYCRRCLDKAI